MQLGKITINAGNHQNIELHSKLLNMSHVFRTKIFVQIIIIIIVNNNKIIIFQSVIWVVYDR